MRIFRVWNVRFRLAVGLVLAAAGLAAALPAGTSATTGPGPFALVYVGLTNSGCHVARSSVFHGTIVEFFVVNKGSKARRFGIAGRQSRYLRPGERQRVYRFFRLRGVFKWHSESFRGPTVKGSFKIT